MVSINGTSKTVSGIFEDAKKVRLVIPEFQRPYEWKKEHVQTLFDDIWNHSIEHPDGDVDYFLGPIVTYEYRETDDSGKILLNECHIIDGQQRLTTLALLLRAIYEQISSDKSDDELDEEEGDVKKALWARNKETRQYDRSVNPIESRVILKEDAEIFNRIMTEGSANNLSGPYADNYRFLQQLIKDKITGGKGVLKFSNFIECLLKNTILLPIIADSMDTAMEIFNTLNDRGMQLSDADIFKSLIYKDLDPSGREAFINDWNRMSKDCENIGLEIQDLFKYYSFYIRARDGEKSSSLISVRKFYSMKNRLKESSLLTNINTILDLYKVTLGQIILTDPEKPYVDDEKTVPNLIKGEEWSNNPSIRKSLDILSSFANDYWNYPVVTYFLSNKDKEGFEKHFDLFLHKLIVELLYTQVIKNNVNDLKTPIMNLNADCINNLSPSFEFSPVDIDEFKEKIKTPHTKLERMFLKVVAYMEDKQTDVIAPNWQVEHIFSQKWDPTVFSQLPADEIKSLIEHIGNKMPLEKIPNIQAGNNFFSKKKVEYKKSNIALAHSISSEYETWNTDSIKMRDTIVILNITSLLKKWTEDYLLSKYMGTNMTSP